MVGLTINNHNRETARSAEEVLRIHREGIQFFQSVTELGLMPLGDQRILHSLGINRMKADESILYLCPISSLHKRNDYEHSRADTSS